MLSVHPVSQVLPRSGRFNEVRRGNWVYLACFPWVLPHRRHSRVPSCLIGRRGNQCEFGVLIKGLENITDVINKSFPWLSHHFLCGGSKWTSLEDKTEIFSHPVGHKKWNREGKTSVC